MTKERKRFLEKLAGGILAVAVVLASIPAFLFTGSNTKVYAQNTKILYMQYIKKEQIKTDGDYYYCEKKDGTIAILGYKGINTEIQVPEQIEGKEVTSLSGAFYHCKNITGIKIPDTVSEIKRSTFEGCTSLTDIELPNSLTFIGSNAFMDCSSLSKINIPEKVKTMYYYIFRGCSNLTEIQVAEENAKYTSIDGVLYNKQKTSLIKYPDGKSGSYEVPDGGTHIETDAFENCSYLKEIIFPASVNNLNGYMFRNCAGLTSIQVEENNPDFTSQDGVLYNKEKTYLIRCPEGKTGDFEIPKDVTKITSSSFRDCRNLTKIYIPESLINTSSSISLFEGCSSLIEIQVAKENSIYSSQDGALYNKSKTVLLRYPSGKSGSYMIPEGVEQIANGAFQECSNLTKVEIPESLTEISDGEFNKCGRLTEIQVSEKSLKYSSDSGSLYNKEKTELVRYVNGKSGDCILPDGIVNIRDSAFQNCDKLIKIVIPESVEKIGKNVFRYCESLTEIQAAEENQNYSSYDGVLYDKIKTRLIQYPIGKAGRYVIPEGVSSIYSRSFEYCSGLTEIEIPESVQYMGYDIFNGCDDLTVIGVKDSRAEQYAKAYNISFRYIHTISSEDNISVSYSTKEDTGRYLFQSKLLNEDDAEYQNIHLSNKIAEDGISPEDVMFCAYSMTFMDESKVPVEPEGTVTVKIPVPQGYKGERCKIYYVKSNGCMENMHAEYVDNELVFRTDHFSIYLITETELKEQSIIYGDINGDGDVNSKDAVLLKKHLAGYEGLTFDGTAADVNGDNKVDSKDAVRLLRYLAGYDMTLGK